MAGRGQTRAIRMVEVEGLRVEVHFKRIKGAHAHVSRDGRATLSVPTSFSVARAEAIVREHADWYRAHLQKVAARTETYPTQWSSGERLSVWGEPRVLVLRPGEDGPECELVGDALVLRCQPQSTAKDRAAAVERFLRAQLQQALQDLRPACEKRVGRQATSITLRRMKTRWGSCTCTTGRIRLNVALAETPPKCLETVLVHELCHLYEANHGPRFYALMDLHMPDWRVWQRWLNEHPPRV